MNYQQKLVLFKQPNRVWRTYTGGKIISQINGDPNPEDSHFPEDWIGSTTRAVNQGRETLCEGISQAQINGETISFDILIERDPTYFLGESHVQAFGHNPMLLVKYLDSSVRLHFQAHPTVEFAREKLNSPCGKAEAYYVLSVREEVEFPSIYLGFKEAVSRETFKETIEQQNIPLMSEYFNAIAIQPEECFYIPGGMPHAIGEGVLMVEIMEPSDWAVRFEFEKSGYVMPEEARFMKRDLDFCLDVFDYTVYSVDEILKKYRKTPQKVAQYNEYSYKSSLIDEETTSRFRVAKSTLKGTVQKSENDFYIGLIVKGSCTIQCGDEQHTLQQFDKFFCPAGMDQLIIHADDGVEILECYPPLPENSMA